ncbi:hypothetical protein [Bacillus kwashiorkori]|nr:hypothetical protein [Bacillus kwashiorkori]
MQQRREKGYSQKGQKSADIEQTHMAKEELKNVIEPTNRQNSKQ